MGLARLGILRDPGHWLGRGCIDLASPHVALTDRDSFLIMCHISLFLANWICANATEEEAKEVLEAAWAHANQEMGLDGP